MSSYIIRLWNHIPVTYLLMSSRENLPNICGTTSHSTSTLTNFVLTIICVHVIDAQDSQYHLTFPRYALLHLTFIVQFKKNFTLYLMLCSYVHCTFLLWARVAHRPSKQVFLLLKALINK